MLLSDMREVNSAMESIIGRFCPIKELWGGLAKELLVKGISARKSQSYLNEGGG